MERNEDTNLDHIIERIKQREKSGHRRLFLYLIPSILVVATLVVYAGTLSTANIPDVLGLPRPTAVSKLQKAGLAVTERYEASDAVPVGIALRTDPPIGARIRKGSIVKLFVSAGPTPVPVRNVVGLNQANA